MIVNAIKTHKITSEDKDILEVLDKYIEKLGENSVVVITSKIISITEGSLVEMAKANKDDLVKKESEYYLSKASNKYKISFTIKDGILIGSAGIDGSNGNGFYVLWPKNSFDSANKVRKFLREKFKLKNLGVIITDSKVTPLRWGVTGFSISYSGIQPLKDYIDKKDLFGKEFEYTKIAVADGLAASAVLVMGEGTEQTPIAIIEQIPFVEFVDSNPSTEEIDNLKIHIKDDLYAPLLTSANWQKGGRDD